MAEIHEVHGGGAAAAQLAAKIRELSRTDPERARTLVEQLVSGLNAATNGTFLERVRELDAARIG